MKLTKKSNLHDVADDITFEEQQLINDICSRDLPPHPFSDWKKFAANQFVMRLRAEFAARYESDVATQAIEQLGLQCTQKTKEEAIAFLQSIGAIDSPGNEEIQYGTELYDYVLINATPETHIGSSNNQRFLTDYFSINRKKYSITSFGDGFEIRRAENYNV